MVFILDNYILASYSLLFYEALKATTSQTVK